ncbi:MAG: RdgB/HAM1 family non-canonical purine NTP pyrophosphatase [Planctomycetes bacterium]|nr:RdgB/HAM1 family non-canonical purine NTP pyrophosphatase [Planctomycetota bacterium]
MNLLFATSNQHKLDEAREILGPLGIEVVGLDSLSNTFEEPVENADTFEGNARLKAIGYAQATGKRCMADDSGLVVDALNGEPGVRSARFAGVGNTRLERDAANNALLLERLQTVPRDRRSARFVCAICVADPDGTIVGESKGTFEGIIGSEPVGTNGFGYDPLLFVSGVNKSSAQMTSEEKNSKSHRGEAVRKIIKCFQQ